MNVDIEKFINLSQEELYVALVPQNEQIAYSKDGIIARGIEIFTNLAEDCKHDICSEYCKKEKEIKTLIDAVNIVLAVLLANNYMAEAIVVPFSVLLAKYGLSKLCNC